MNIFQFLFLCVFLPIIVGLYIIIGSRKHNQQIQGQYLSAKGTWLITRYGNNQFSIAPTEIPDQKMYLQIPDWVNAADKKKLISSSHFSDNDNYLAWFLQETQHLLIFDLRSGQLHADIRASSLDAKKILNWAWLKDLTLAFNIKTYEGESTLIWDIQQKRIAQTLEVPRFTTAIRFSDDGNLMCTEQAHSETKYSITILNQVTQKNCSFEIRNLEEWYLCGNLLLAESFVEKGDDYHTILRLWDIETEKLILERRYENDSLTALLPHPDQEHVLIRWEEQCGFWNIKQDSLKPIEHVKYRLRWSKDYSEIRYLDENHQLGIIPTPEFRISN